MDTYLAALRESMTVAVNPFDVTKAVDFDDAEIARTYVDFKSGALHEVLSPSKALPIFLVGGKGGGRTHLLRRFSHSVRANEGLGSLEHVKASGYLGVYFRCSGLNGSRFSGKRQTDDVWADAFAAYMDLWITQLVLAALVEIDRQEIQGGGSGWDVADKSAFVSQVLSVGDMESIWSESGTADPMVSLSEAIAGELRTIDREVNNAALTGQLDIVIRAAPGELVFSASNAAQAALPGLGGVKTTFLVDEFENLAMEQQRYVNTLIREKPHSCTFVVGSRRWGVRTMETLTTSEPNRQGSEFEQIILEDQYRASRAEYMRFCEQLVSGRLRIAGLGEWSRADINQVLGGMPRSDLLLQGRLQRDGIGATSSHHVDRLRDELNASFVSSGSTEQIIAALQVPENPVLEKWAFLELYRHWSTKGPPSMEQALQIGARARQIMDGSADKTTAQSWKHWKQDLIAQLYVESGEAAPYFGFEQFVDLSGYLPRNLLVLLKNVTRWSNFGGEDVFGTKTSIRSSSLRRGVIEASRWFRAESMPLGETGLQIDRAVNRLGQFLRAHRFSAKPVEVACCGFSSDLQGVSQDAREVIEESCLHGLLIEAQRSDRNSGVHHRAFQMAPMITPEFDLSPARRGLLALKAPEVNAIFDPSASDADFDGVISNRLKSLTAPFREDASAEAIF